MDCFEPCSVQIGDKAFYTIKSTDKILTVSTKGKKTVLHHLLKDDAISEENSNNMTETDMNAINTAEAEHGDNPSEDVDYSKMNGEASPMETQTELGAGDNPPEANQEEEEEWEDDSEGEGGDSDAGSTASSSHSNSSHKKAKKGGVLKTKLLKSKKLKRSRRTNGGGKMPVAGETIPVEIIFTESRIDVMWQVSQLNNNYYHDN